MFRPNTTADLNEFPALGTPPTLNRSMNNRLGTSYASTAGNNGFQQQQQQQQQGASEIEDLKNNLAFNRGNFSNNNNQPRSFSMDEFPALRSSAVPFDNAIGGRDAVNNSTVAGGVNKPEQWLDYANLRESQPQGKPFPDTKAAPGSSESWIQSRKSTQDEVNDGKSTDPYGLLGLLGVIRMTDPDRSMLALGSDLTTLGLDLNTSDSIYSTFISPWSDTQTLPGLNVEPGYYLPACYRNVQATPPAHQRMRTFSDEILFYVFYCMPKDIAQEAAAQELYARNWRYHKELGLWLTKETDENGRPVQSFRRTSPNALDRGVYVFFDPTTWQKVKREWTLSWDAIEERSQPATTTSNQVSTNQASTSPGANSSSSNTNRMMM
ncbi:General negative regulator of transcription subunit 2 [Choanephora cucurbitarum]|uniref:General negative regulator of transcription subunit 2 n=1 Tax=Choanephora cucurbitarum TaxID=101091 RepID=A0A1C7NLC7_9FUNG|nr:General negative regulator of transcription subunit 2 [Choanephora cucurbitarum]